ncbi:peptidase inhibitor family I36 protein [Streptomyces sp. enrichment culture]|uniref:peptidase inhibitor family I36 protein n=1 Tax=Streptomyces sp. enrichment culture TaxID=1795815 RepID=UPI003F54A83E
MRKRIAALAAATAAVFALAAPTAASAEETRVTEVPGVAGLYWLSGGDYGTRAWSECGSGSCFFQNSNGGGWLWVVPSCGHHVVPSWFQDRASSAWNRTSTPIHLYRHSDYTGYLGTVPAGFQGNLAAAHNDVLSSVFAAC